MDGVERHTLIGDTAGRAVGSTVGIAADSAVGNAVGSVLCFGVGMATCSDADHVRRHYTEDYWPIAQGTPATGNPSATALFELVGNELQLMILCMKFIDLVITRFSHRLLAFGLVSSADAACQRWVNLTVPYRIL